MTPRYCYLRREIVVDSLDRIVKQPFHLNVCYHPIVVSYCFLSTLAVSGCHLRQVVAAAAVAAAAASAAAASADAPASAAAAASGVADAAAVVVAVAAVVAAVAVARSCC